MRNRSSRSRSTCHGPTAARTGNTASLARRAREPSRLPVHPLASDTDDAASRDAPLAHAARECQSPLELPAQPAPRGPPAPGRIRFEGSRSVPRAVCGAAMGNLRSPDRGVRAHDVTHCKPKRPYAPITTASGLGALEFTLEFTGKRRLRFDCRISSTSEQSPWSGGGSFPCHADPGTIAPTTENRISLDPRLVQPVLAESRCILALSCFRLVRRVLATLATVGGCSFWTNLSWSA